VDFVVAICSVGSLKASIGVGALMVPDDFYCPADLRRVYTDARAHLMPGFDEGLRSVIVDVVRAQGRVYPLTHGTYVNTKGPRFETKAEIRIMAQAGDIVGMTAAHECVACAEVGLPYAAVCMVDNYAHGIGEKLTVEAFHEAQAANLATLEAVVETLLNNVGAAMVKAGRAPRLRVDSSHAASGGAGSGSAGDASPTGSVESPAVALPTPVPSSPVAPIPVDTLVHARYVVPMAPGHEELVLDHHSVAMQGGVIIDVLPTEAARVRYTAAHVVNLDHRHCLIPGLINAHTHLPLNLLRGVADDLPLAQWLTEQIWPTEARLVAPDFCRAGAQAAIAELIRSGVTCINEMYFFPASSAAVIAEVGLRATVGLVTMEFPTGYAANAREYIDKGLAVAADFRAAHERSARPDAPPRVRFSLSPHAPYTVSDDTFTTLDGLSKEHGMKVHVHLHETEGEVRCSRTGEEGSTRHLSASRCSPVENLDRLGLLSDRLIAVHMTQLTDAEIARLAATRTNVVHCPNSNLKLASGFCPVAKLLKAGVNVAIGTDSASSNNSLDFFQEMKLAAVLAKGVSSDATAVPAWQALRMATYNGAVALGIEAHVGSLQAGKRADIVAVDLGGIDQAPVFNVISHLVYACSRHNVTDVWVDGQALLTDRHLVTLDEGRVMESIAAWAEKVRPGATAADKHAKLHKGEAAHVHTAAHGPHEAGKVHVSGGTSHHSHPHHSHHIAPAPGSAAGTDLSAVTGTDGDATGAGAV